MDEEEWGESARMKTIRLGIGSSGGEMTLDRGLVERMVDGAGEREDLGTKTWVWKGGGEVERYRRDLGMVVGFFEEGVVERESGGYGRRWERERVLVLKEAEKEGCCLGRRVELRFQEALFLGLHLATMFEDERAIEMLFGIVLKHLEWLLKKSELVKIRFLWPWFVKGVMGPKTEEGKKALVQDAERMMEVVKWRLKNGVEFPFLDEPMRNLVAMLAENTRRHAGLLVPNDSSSDWRSEISDEEGEKQSLEIRVPGATAEMIEELEESLGVKLPRDYKEFLTISNGLDHIWNGSARHHALGSTQDIPSLTFQDPDSDAINILPVLVLVPMEELPSIRSQWPILQGNTCVVIARDESMESLELVRGHMMQEARDWLLERMEELKQEPEVWLWVKRILADFYGEQEELKELWEAEEGAEAWGIVHRDKDGFVLQAWSSFREWMEYAVVESEFPLVTLEKRDWES
jgi:SMI1 / KNR4 family (SUKH-1)